jgi:peptide/nickel transport system permease protein
MGKGGLAISFRYRYILKRVLQAIPVIFSIIIIVFIMVQSAPGDIALYFIGKETPTPAEVAEVRRRYGLDKPLWTQFTIYISKVIKLDLGYSWGYGAPVIRVIAQRIPATLLLILTSFIFSLSFGIILGAVAARKQGGVFDLASSLSLVTLYSTPTFWGALILILFFAVNLRLFPTSGMIGIGGGLGLKRIIDILYHLFLPSLSLSIFYMLGMFFRITRSSVIEVSGEDFITTAKAVGFDDNTVFIKHALRNALLPVLTVAGMEMGYLFSGALMTETVFAWPGLGRLTYESIISRDFPLLMGCYIIASLAVIVANLATDILYTFFDPRVKLE